jgi:hypothetical protein
LLAVGTASRSTLRLQSTKVRGSRQRTTQAVRAGCAATRAQAAARASSAEPTSVLTKKKSRRPSP